MALTRFGEICRMEEVGVYHKPDTIEDLIKRSNSEDRYDLVLAANNPHTPKEVVPNFTFVRISAKEAYKYERRVCDPDHQMESVYYCFLLETDPGALGL